MKSILDSNTPPTSIFVSISSLIYDNYKLCKVKKIEVDGITDYNTAEIILQREEEKYLKCIHLVSLHTLVQQSSNNQQVFHPPHALAIPTPLTPFPLHPSLPLPYTLHSLSLTPFTPSPTPITPYHTPRSLTTTPTRAKEPTPPLHQRINLAELY